MTPRTFVILAAAAGLAAGAAFAVMRSGPAAIVEGAAQADACANQAEAAKVLVSQAKGDIAALIPANPPQSLSGLAFTGEDGKAMTLAEFSGKALVVNLWATWCVPCRKEMPALDALQSARGGADFAVVAVNVDRGGPEKPEAFLEAIGAKTLSRFFDPKLSAFNDLKQRGLVLGLPATMIVGKDGCLLAHMNGPAEWASPDALAFADAAKAY